jgi:hypothetical protein
MAKTDGCVFCHARADITGEHVWSKWFSNMLGAKIYTVVRKDAEGNAKIWKSGKLDSKSKVVCAKCNNGWMSELEGKTKLVIQHMAVSCEPTKLSRSDNTTIAEFSFLKAVIADHSHDNRGPFFSRSERENFRETLELPDGFQMWLASLPIHHGIFKSFYAAAPQNFPGRFEINAFTYGLGHLVIQCSTCRWTNKRNRRFASPPRLTQGIEWNAISLAAFPVECDPVFWPPNAHMDLQLIDPFAQRWKDVTPGWIDGR